MRKKVKLMKIKAELKNRLKYALGINDKKAVDLVRDLKIPKSAVSQYLSGKSQNMDSERLYIIAKYLNVSEAWLMGYDVPMERKEQKKDDTKEGTANESELSESMKLLIEFAKSVPEDKADLVLRVMKSILADSQ